MSQQSPYIVKSDNCLKQTIPSTINFLIVARQIIEHVQTISKQYLACSTWHVLAVGVRKYQEQLTGLLQICILSNQTIQPEN